MTFQFHSGLKSKIVRFSQRKESCFSNFSKKESRQKILLFFALFLIFRSSHAFYTSLVTIFLWSVLSQKSNISFEQKINWVFVGLSEIEVNFWCFKTIIQSYLMRPLWHALICAHFSFLEENHRALELEKNKWNLGSHNKSLFFG